MNINLIKVIEDNGFVNLDLINIDEKKLSITFPESYKKFIKQHNAAYPENCYFNYWNDYLKEEGMKSFSFYGFEYQQGFVSESESLIDSQDFDVYGYDHVIAFGSTPEGDYICFDYRHDPSTPEPKIAIMAHDLYYKNINKMIISHVADSFDEFCTLLYDYSDEVDFKD